MTIDNGACNKRDPLPVRVRIARLNRALRPLMSGVGSRENGLDSLFAPKPVGPWFEPCLGQSAKLAGAPKPFCLSVVHACAKKLLAAAVCADQVRG